MILGSVISYQHDMQQSPAFIKSLKLQIGEEAYYNKVIARCRSEGLGNSWNENMKIVPVNFNKEHETMLGHCKMILSSFIMILSLT